MDESRPSNVTTDPKEGGAQLSNQERCLRDFFEGVAVPIHCVTEDGTVLWMNKAGLRLLGYPPGESIGRSIANFVMDETAAHDLLQKLKASVKVENYAVRLRRKDGSPRDASLNSSVFCEAGRPAHSRWLSFNVTQEQEGGELHQRLSAIVENSDDAIISKDLNGIIRSWNPGAARIFGYSAEEIVGQHVSVLAAPDRLDEIPNILDRLVRGERVDHYETKRKTKDGRILTISLTVSPIRDELGNITGASKVARDITDKSLQEQALREAVAALTRSNADLEQFAYSASHDLQEPLRMVVTYCELLERELGANLGETGRGFLGYAIQGALRMEQLLMGLRAYTLASMGSAPRGEVEADLSLDRALANLKTATQESAAVITRTKLPRVQIGDVELEQVFQNLIANAIRYRRTNPPRIDISAEPAGDGFRFAVKDNGLGIDARYTELIFGLFKRLYTTAEYPGTGLGLAISQRIIDRAGGRIWVESELGVGSTFFFTLPSRGE